MVRRRFRPIIALAAVIAAAGSVTAAGLTFTAQTVQKSVAELPQIKQPVLPSYVVRLPDPKPAAAVEVAAKTPDPLPVPASAVAAPEPLAVAEIAQPDAAPANDSLYVVKSDVFVRSGPSKSYQQIGTAKGGMEVNVTGEDGGWLQVSFAGGSGWVYGRYLAPARGEQVAEAF